MLHQLASTYNARPSAMLGIEDNWLALSVDRAVFTWGRHVDNKLRETFKDGKTPRYSIEELLDIKENSFGDRLFDRVPVGSTGDI